MSAKILTAINPHIINKIHPDQKDLWYKFTNSFENVELTLDELADSINQGFATCAQHKGKRSNSNFIRTNVLFVDIDDGLSIDDALDMPFVQKHASLLHTTVSHKPEHHRFRLVFQLERVIEDSQEMCNAIRGLIFKFGADESCKDACRGYFGSRGCKPIVLGKTLPNSELSELIFHGENKKKLDSHKANHRNKKTSTASSAVSQIFQLDRNHLLQMPSGAYAHLHQLPKGMSVFCPYHLDRRPSAFVIENRYGIRGVYCHSCKLSFWPKDLKGRSTPYNFYSYEQYLLDLLKIKPLPATIKNKIFEEMKYSIADIQVFNSQYIDKNIPLQKGITFMRSPKGSGKTEWLSEIVKKCKQQNKKILLIGHRRSLIIGLASRLGITCYIHYSNDKTKYVRPTDCYAVCVDSVSKMLDLKEHKYDVIIIDESEQVLSHATAKTVKEKRRAVCNKMFYYFRKAESIILADADLDVITTSTMWDIVGDRKKYYLYMNSYKEQDRKISDFSDYFCLVDDLLVSIQSGGKYFVSTNSKNEAEALDYFLRKKCGSINVLLVTSGTTEKPNVRRLLSDVVNEIVKYDVVIASPTMGTGIDITFPAKKTVIDGVYGFYVGGVNTHFDIDQQLSRVRHPGFIKTWICDFPCNEETDVDIIKTAMKNSDEIDEIIIGYSEDGDPMVDEEYLNLFSIVKSVNNASKNNLKGNFFELRENNGWKIDAVDCESLEEQALTNVYDDMMEVKIVLKEQKNNNIVNAEAITDESYKLLSSESKSRNLSDYEKNSMRRWEIEKFYKTSITKNLVELDDNARYREKISLLETYLENFAVLKIQGKAERSRYSSLLPDKKHLSSKKAVLYELLRLSGVANAKSKIDLNCKITSENLKMFSDFCQKNYAEINSLLSVNVAPKDLEKKPVSTLGRVLGVIGLEFTRGIRSKKAGETIYTYELDKNAYNRAIQIVHRRRNSRDDALVEKRVRNRQLELLRSISDTPHFDSNGVLIKKNIITDKERAAFMDILNRDEILFKRKEKVNIAKRRLKQKKEETGMRRDFFGEFKNGKTKSKISLKQKLLSNFKSIKSTNKRKHVEKFVMY